MFMSLGNVLPLVTLLPSSLHLTNNETSITFKDFGDLLNQTRCYLLHANIPADCIHLKYGMLSSRKM
ncbi:hypothetical protein Trydic_g22317 [Trypoxylus dichotomus]